jgi:hypothetical protein
VRPSLPCVWSSLCRAFSRTYTAEAHGKEWLHGSACFSGSEQCEPPAILPKLGDPPSCSVRLTPDSSLFLTNTAQEITVENRT